MQTNERSPCLHEIQQAVKLRNRLNHAHLLDHDKALVVVDPSYTPLQYEIKATLPILLTTGNIYENNITRFDKHCGVFRGAISL